MKTRDKNSLGLMDQLLRAAGAAKRGEARPTGSSAEGELDPESYARFLSSEANAPPEGARLENLAASVWGSAIAVVALGSRTANVRKQLALLGQLEASGGILPVEDEEEQDLDSPLWLAFDVGSGRIGGDAVDSTRLASVAHLVRSKVEASGGVGACLAVGRGRIGLLGPEGRPVQEAIRGSQRVSAGQLSLSPSASERLGSLGFRTFLEDADPQLIKDRGAPAWMRLAQGLEEHLRDMLLVFQLNKAERGGQLRGADPATDGPNHYRGGDKLSLSTAIPPGHFAYLLLQSDDEISCLKEGKPVQTPQQHRAEFPLEIIFNDSAARERPILLVSEAALSDLPGLVSRVTGNHGGGRDAQLQRLYRTLCQEHKDQTLGFFYPPEDFIRVDTQQMPSGLQEVKAALERGDLQRAVSVAQQSLAGEVDPATRIELRIRLGHALRRLGHTDEAVKELRSATQLAHTHDEFALAADAEREMANSLVGAGLVEAAWPHIRKALEGHERARDEIAVARDHLVSGKAHWIAGRMDAAAESFQRIIEPARERQDHQLLAAAQQRLGVVYHDLGDLNRAEAHYRGAAAALEALGDTLSLAITWGDLGLVALDRRDPSTARGWFQKQVDGFEGIASDEYRAAAWANLARANLELGDTGAASEALQRARANPDLPEGGRVASSLALLDAELALALGGADAAREGAAALLASRADLLGEQVWRAALVEARASSALGEDAAPVFEAGASRLDAQRAALPLPMRTRFLDTTRRFFDAWVDYLDAHRGPDDTLMAVESTRSRTLLEVLSQQPATALQDREDRLAPWILDRGTASQLRASLPPGTAVVDICCLEDRTLLLWTDRASTRRYESPAGRAKLEALAAAVRESCSSPSADRHAGGAWVRLSELLLNPLQAELSAAGPELAIGFVIDPALANVPLQALPFGEGDRALVDAHAIYYAPTLKAVVHWNRLGSAGATGALILANAERDLPGAETEASQLARMLKQPHLQLDEVRLLTQRQATAAALWEAAHTARILHLAVHAGKAGARESAWIRLAPSSPTAVARLPTEVAAAASTGVLGVDDVSRLPLAAELVSLSACESGAGQLTPAGEGPDLLSWAFLAARARSVIATSWKVDDGACEKLFEVFYAQWLAGTRKVEALRLAQLALRQTVGSGSGLRRGGKLAEAEAVDYSHPYYWAAFILTGDWR